MHKFENKVVDNFISKKDIILLDKKFLRGEINLKKIFLLLPLALLLIFIASPVLAADPLPLETDAAMIQMNQKIDDISTKINSLINQNNQFQADLLSDLNAVKNDTKASISASQGAILQDTQHKVDYPTLITALIFVSALNWVFFGFLKGTGKL